MDFLFRPPFGPFVMGFVVQRVSYVWIYYILAIVSFPFFIQEQQTMNS